MAKKSNTYHLILKELLLLAALFSIAYLGSQNLKLWLGQRAIDQTGFEAISLDAALIQAKAENKLVLVDFAAIWCSTCRKLDTQVLAQPEVKDRIESNYVFTRLEYESDDVQLFEHYGIQQFPTLMVLNSDGSELRQLSLTLDPDNFVGQL